MFSNATNPTDIRSWRAGSWLALALCSSQPTLAVERSDLIQRLEVVRAEKNMPGLRIAILTREGVLHRAAVGVADLDTEQPLDNHISMPGGSTGKTFVAVLTMLLVEDGTLSLDDPAAKWLGETAWYSRLPNANAIQIRHLLSHSAGLPDYPSTLRFNAKLAWRALRHGSAWFQPEELIGFVLDRKPTNAVGQGFHYTDAGYLVLGRLIEAATGRPYYELLTERVLIPHRLHGVKPQDQSILPNTATGYMDTSPFGLSRVQRDDGRTKLDHRSEWTGGGLILTPTMLVQFYAALAAGEIVSPASFAQMLVGEWRDPDGSTFHYGYGLFVYNDGQSFGHEGMWPGYRTHVAHHRNSGLTIAVQTNRDGSLDMPGVSRRVAEWVSQLRN